MRIPATQTRKHAIPEMRPHAGTRGYDTNWQKLRLNYLHRNPLCQRCLGNGQTTPATEVHHMQPIATKPDLRLEWSNLMAVCRPCHDAIEPNRVRFGKSEPSVS